MNYRQQLFVRGAKSFSPYNKRSLVLGRGTCCGSGVKSNLDNQLLSLVSGVARMSVKPKLRTKTSSGKGLKFIR